MFYITDYFEAMCKHHYKLANRASLKLGQSADWMDIQDTEGWWTALGSRDALSREAAMDSIRQEVMMRVEKAAPPGESSSSADSAVASSNDLNDTLARLLMLSKRCPFSDVRERCARILRTVQVGDGQQSEKPLPEMRLSVAVRCLSALIGFHLKI